MGDFILIYDTNDSDIVDMSKKRAVEVGAQAIGVGGVTELKAAFTRLKDSGVRIKRLLFYTHGDPGALYFGLNTLVSTRILSEFAGNGFEDLFLPDARVNFDGCNVAEVKKGCEIGADCAASDNGVVFLSTFAKTFLFKGGGRVVGWTSAGWGFPILGGTVIHHPTGTAVHAFINRGGTRVRIGVGRGELDSPVGGWWKVSIDRQLFYYKFQSDLVFWISEAQFFSVAGMPNPKLVERGTWRLEPDGLKIKWNSGESETWDVPLFDEYQTGTAIDSIGFDLDIYARKAPQMY